MKLIRYAFFILSFVVLPAAAVAQTGTIAGTVSVTGGLALHDASVTVVGTNKTARSDAEGKFEIAGVRTGRQTIRVHVEGFSDAVETVTVAANSTVVIDILLEIAALREQVTVTASGTEQSVMDSFQTVNSVGSTRIAEKAATSIGEVLENETGVAKRSFGPGASRPIIRGFDGDRVLVLQDGVRTGSIASQSGDHGEPIDPLAAERIEVVKGPATLLYGSNAIGGVVNVIGHHENDFYPGFRGYATGVAGTANSQAGFSGGGEYGIDNWLLRGSVGAQRTGDLDTPIGTIPNSSSRSNTGSFGAGYYRPKGWLSGTFSVDVRRFGVPFAGEFHGHHEKEAIFGEEHEDHDIDVDLRSRRYNFRVAGGFRDLTNPFISGVQYSLDQTDYRHKELEIDTEHTLTEVGTIFDNRTLSYRALFEQQKHRMLTGRFGFEGFSRDYRVEGEEQLINGKVDHDSFSVFGLEEIDLKRIKLQFGGRIENNRYSPENSELLERSFTGFSGGAGINIPLWEGGSFVTNYTYSYRAPSLEELYNFGPHVGTMTYEIGDQMLENEKANGIDVSLRHSSGRFRFFGDIYYYGIKNFVYLAPVDEDGDGKIDVEDGLPMARYSQADASYFGAELSADVKLTELVELFVGLDTVRAKLTNDELNIPRIPPARARVGLDIRYKGLSIRPEAIFAADQNNIYPLETRTAGYGLFNLAGSYVIGRAHHAHIFSLNAYNLTDRLYRNHSNFVKDLMPEIGRGIRFSYTVRFF